MSSILLPFKCGLVYNPIPSRFPVGYFDGLIFKPFTHIVLWCVVSLALHFVMKPFFVYRMLHKIKS